MDFQGPIARANAFLKDLLPENLAQLLFPLGSFLLLIGSWSPWLPPHHTLIDPLWQSAEPNLWFDAYSRLPKVAYYVSLFSVRVAFLASLVLWSLPIRDSHRRFRHFVFIPVGLGVTIFSVLVLIAKNPRISVAQPASQVAYEVVRRFPSRLAGLGMGFYLTLAGAMIIAGALWGDQPGRILLPVKFRNRPVDPIQTTEKQQAGRDVLVLLIATSVAVAILSLVFVQWTQALTWRSGDFPTIEWLLGTCYAAIAAICAIAILSRNKQELLRQLLLPLTRSDAALGVGIALLVACVPRILFGMAQQFNWGSIGVDSGVPYSWPELLFPKPFLWLLLVYITALLQEIVLRGFLQAKLAPVVGLGRAIFLVGLLWGILPLQYGIRTGLGMRAGLPGIGTLISFAILVAYSIPFGWLFARTDSVIQVAVMHGTFILFHKGSNENVYLNHPSLYWLELAALVFVGWYLFDRYPVMRAIEPRGVKQSEAD